MEHSKVVSSQSLFIDTRDGTNGKAQGDHCTVALGQTIDARDGEVIRLSLKQFSMYSNFSPVNFNNTKFVLTTSASAVPVEGAMAPGWYETLYELSAAFAAALEPLIVAASAAAGSTVTQATVSGESPPATETLAQNRDRIMQFTLTTQDATGATVAHNLTSVLIQSFERDGDLWALLGGDRIVGTASTAPSFNVTVTATTIVVSGLYPMQRSTDTHVYLRCGQLSTNIEMSSLSPQFPPYGQMSQNSTIFARIPINLEFSEWEAESIDMFKMILPQRTLSYLSLFLTDHKGRPLNRALGADSQTATGSGTRQSTLGNLFFGATVSIEVLQTALPNQTRFARLPNPATPSETAMALQMLDPNAYITNNATRNAWAQRPVPEPRSARAHNHGLVGRR